MIAWFPSGPKVAFGDLQPTRSDWVFALRTVSAGLIALLIAYGLDLDHPQWAMMTVFIVAQPVAGMVLAKGFYRLLGSLAGANAAVAVSLLFGDNPLLFIGALALWIGLCTYVSSLLRNPEAYGAALAGYTATIVALPSFGHPHLVVDLAVARCTEIMLGIVCAGLASRLVLPLLAGEAMRAKLKRCVTDLAVYAHGAFAGGDPARLSALHRQLVTETQALGEMRAYARLEAPSQATRAHSVRRTIGSLLSALSAARMLYEHAAPENAALMPVRNELKGVLSDLAKAPDAGDDTAPWIERLDAVATHARQPSAEPVPEDAIGTATRLTVAAEFAGALREVLLGLDALRRPGSARKRDRRQPALVIHHDHHAAWRNAVRAAIATLLVAAFWMVTKWSEAAGVVIIVAVVSSLFAPRPNPVEVAWGFFKGTLIAMPFAFVVGQLMLPVLPGFGWFVLFVVPILIPASLAMANPRYVGVATAFAINFLAFLSPHQVMVYDPAAFLGGSASILIGIALAIGVFIVVLPADAAETAAHIAQAIRDGLVRLCLHERIPRRTAFENLAYDRVNQLMPLVQRLGKQGDRVLGGSVAAVTVGLEVLRLRNARQAGTLPADAAQTVSVFLRALAHELLVALPNDPDAGIVARARAVAADIASAHKAGPALQAAASLRIIAAAIEDFPEFFAKPGG